MSKNYFDGVSVQELEQELDRRKKAAKAPVPLDNPDFSGLTSMALKETEYLIKNGYPSKDFKHYVYESVMEAVYGPDYWKWRNSLDCD